jgi:hypothetical protein
VSGEEAGERWVPWQRTLFVAFVVLWGVSLFSIPVADNDLWGHVYFGRAILEEGSVPPLNRYSYTSPEQPWINHETLAEVAFAWTYDHAGSPGLLVLKMLIGLCTLAIVARTTSRRVISPLACGTALFLAGSSIALGFLVRPQIFSCLALAVVWDRLDAHDQSRRTSTLVALPVLFAFWVNAHGGVAAGLGVLLAYVLIDRLRSPWEQWRWTALMAALCGLALLVNPYGLRLLAFLWADLTQSRAISEWQPISLIDASFVTYKLVVAVLAVGLVVNRRRRPWEIVIVGVAVLATFRHQRHLPLFGILAAPALAETTQELLSRLPRPFAARAVVSLLAVTLVVATALAAQLAARLHGELRGQIFVAPGQFPVAAVRFMKQNALSGNLLLPFDWGEYAIWHLYPRCSVSVDGRYTTAYPPSVLEASREFFTGRPGWEQSLGAATIVLMSRRQPNASALFADPKWAYVYSDATALVFVRNDALGEKPLIRSPASPEQPPIFP